MIATFRKIVDAFDNLVNCNYEDFQMKVYLNGLLPLAGL